MAELKEHDVRQSLLRFGELSRRRAKIDAEIEKLTREREELSSRVSAISAENEKDEKYKNDIQITSLRAGQEAAHLQTQSRGHRLAHREEPKAHRGAARAARLGREEHQGAHPVARPPAPGNAEEPGRRRPHKEQNRGGPREAAEPFRFAQAEDRFHPCLARQNRGQPPAHQVQRREAQGAARQPRGGHTEARGRHREAQGGARGLGGGAP